MSNDLGVQSQDEAPSFEVTSEAGNRMNAIAVIRQKAHRLRLEAQGLDAFADFIYPDVRAEYPLSPAADEALWKLAIS